MKRQVYGKRALWPIEEEMTADTIFDLASVSKCVGTNSMAMKLIEDGIMKLEDPVANYIHNFSKQGKANVLIKHLLTHTSGLAPYADVNDIKKTYPTLPSYDAEIEYFAALGQHHKEGTYYTYSCLNFLTMMRTNEIAKGNSGDEYLKEKVFGPLKMKDTTWFLSADQKKRTAPTEKYPNGTYMRGDVHDPLANYYLKDSQQKHCSGNAGLYSTIDDLSIYARMLLNGGIFDNTRVYTEYTVNDLIMKRQLSPNPDAPRTYGWGIGVSCPQATRLNWIEGNEVILHTGFTGTRVWMDKKSKAFFVLLTNRVHIPGGEEWMTGWGVADLVLRSIDVYQDYFKQHPVCENYTSIRI